VRSLNKRPTKKKLAHGFIAMAFVEITHYSFHYIVAGQPEKPPLLMLHGFLGSHQDFLELLPTLSQHFYCIVPDLPGHGQTQTQKGCYGFEAIAQSLIQFLDALEISQTHLLGYSMGGRLALYLACYFSNRFTRIALESASPGLKTAEERRERRERDDAIAHQLETIPLPDFFTQWYANPLFTSLQNHPEAYAIMLQSRQHNHPTALAHTLRGCSTGRQPSLWPALQIIDKPLLLLTGALDTKFIAINRDMLSHMGTATQATLTIVENCGHNLHIEASNIYSKTLVEFFDT
jgi:2-succinyl-6-hydroxy-2,4-cyclohexadiene-1-carboxylate synthase